MRMSDTPKHKKIENTSDHCSHHRNKGSVDFKNDIILPRQTAVFIAIVVMCSY